LNKQKLQKLQKHRSHVKNSDAKCGFPVVGFLFPDWTHLLNRNQGTHVPLLARHSSASSREKCITSSTMNQTQRFLAINGSHLKGQRLQRGMTQLQLAKAAGYSDRLIRKAEHGGTLDIATIQNLAEALCENDKSVTWESLVLDNLAIARIWVSGMDSLGPKMLPAVEPYLAEDFVLYCPGDPQLAAFMGTFHGTAGFQEWLDAFFSEFTRQPASELEYFVGDDTIIARWMELVHLQGIPCGPIRISMHFRFHNGLIIRIEYDYDTKTGADSITEARRLLAKTQGRGDARMREEV
jgi:transcriptional regulator with XRE-family HTH domain